MKVLELNEKKVNIEICFVWDRQDKFLVIIDHLNKIKYLPDTFLSSFDKYNVFDLTMNFLKRLTGSNDFSYSYDSKAPRRICHNDDFPNYRKSYKTVYPKECREIGLWY